MDDGIKEILQELRTLNEKSNDILSQILKYVDKPEKNKNINSADDLKPSTQLQAEDSFDSYKLKNGNESVFFGDKGDRTLDEQSDVLVTEKVPLDAKKEEAPLTKDESPLKDVDEKRAEEAARKQPIVEAKERAKEKAKREADKLYQTIYRKPPPEKKPPQEKTIYNDYHSKKVVRERKPIDTAKQEEIWGRRLGYIGISALFVGVAFFIRYAVEMNWISEIGRVSLAVILGVAFLVTGKKMREDYARYSDVLMGGGIAILYLSIFGAHSFYGLISSTTAFLIMALVTVAAGVISVSETSLTLAIIGILGGFLTPIMVSTGQNKFYGLFTYILMLDLGILGMAFYKRWNVLNYIGFLGTLIIFGGWAERHYSEDQLLQTFIYMTLFFIVYVFTFIIHHFVRKEKTVEVDIVMLTFNATIYFGAGYLLLEPNYDYLHGFYAFFLAAGHFALSYYANKVNAEDKLLNLLLLSFSIIFMTLAIPLQLSDHWIALAWALEAVALIYIAFQTKMEILRRFGGVILTIGFLRFLSKDMTFDNIVDFTLVFNHRFMLSIAFVAAFYAIAYLYKKNIDILPKKEAAKKLILALIILGNILSVGAITMENFTHYDKKRYLLIEKVKVAVDEINMKALKKNGFKSMDQNVYREKMNEGRKLIRHQQNTSLSIVWALYAVLLMLIGIFKRVRMMRLAGMVFFFSVAIKVFLDVWELGQLYRIISSITFGAIALGISFIYAKYKDKLKDFI